MLIVHPQFDIPMDVGMSAPDVRSMLDRAKYACNTAALLDPAWNQCSPEPIEKFSAQTIFNELAQGDVIVTPKVMGQYSNGTLRHLDSLLQTYDTELVNVAVRLRHYVTNKLIEESTSDDGKDRLKALELLGKIKDVALFSERVTVSIAQKPTEELENLLRLKVEKFLGNAVVVQDNEPSHAR